MTGSCYRLWLIAATFLALAGGVIASVSPAGRLSSGLILALLFIVVSVIFWTLGAWRALWLKHACRVRCPLCRDTVLNAMGGDNPSTQGGGELVD